jgi:hypothetical protein
MISRLAAFPRSARLTPTWKIACLGAIAALAVGFSPLAVHAQTCAKESAVKSAQAGGAQVELSFRNASAQRRRIYWIDEKGERKFYGVVDPGHVLQQPSFPGFAWVVTDETEKCLNIVTATDQSMTINIGGPAAAVAPPPGVETPIVQAPPPAGAEAPIASAPPAAATLPTLPGTTFPTLMQQAPAPTPAPQPTAEVPQVSPIEQFQLTGTFRLIPPDDPHKALNFGSGDRVEIVRVQSRWESAKWSFEEVPGTPYVRVKNEWKHTFLVDHDGELHLSDAGADEQTTQWSFEPIDGTPYVQLQNRATEHYLLTVDGEPVLADAIPPKHENRSRWDVVSTAQDAVASELNDDYARAVADCRAIDGYWTGASCRAPGPVALRCPRGWLWSPDDDACIWAGHEHCPPWQMRHGRCFAELTCAGGHVRLSGHGQSCHCPPGMAAWGHYPHLRCVPSLARIVPLLNKILGGNGPGNKPGKFGWKQQYGRNKGKGTINGLNGQFNAGNGGPFLKGPQQGGVKGGAQQKTTTGKPTTGIGLNGGEWLTTTKVDPKTGIKTTISTGIDPKTGIKMTSTIKENPKTQIVRATMTGVDAKTGKPAVEKYVLDQKTGNFTDTVSVLGKNGKPISTKTAVVQSDAKTGNKTMTTTSTNRNNGTTTTKVVVTDKNGNLLSTKAGNATPPTKGKVGTAASTTAKQPPTVVKSQTGNNAATNAAAKKQAAKAAAKQKVQAAAEARKQAAKEAQEKAKAAAEVRKQAAKAAAQARKQAQQAAKAKAQAAAAARRAQAKAAAQARKQAQQAAKAKAQAAAQARKQAQQAAKKAAQAARQAQQKKANQVKTSCPAGKHLVNGRCRR